MQACLESHLHGDLLRSQGDNGGLVGEGGAEGGAARASHMLGLSPPCATALFQRQVGL